MDCNKVLSEFLPIDCILRYNVLNKLFYNKIIPIVMKNRGIYPTITPELHLLIKENTLWSLQFSNSVNLKEIDFEEDEWRHDNQYVIEDKSLGKLEPILPLTTLYEPNMNDPMLDMDEGAKLGEDEEIIP